MSVRIFVPQNEASKKKAKFLKLSRHTGSLFSKGKIKSDDYPGVRSTMHGIFGHNEDIYIVCAYCSYKACPFLFV